MAKKEIDPRMTRRALLGGAAAFGLAGVLGACGDPRPGSVPAADRSSLGTSRTPLDNASRIPDAVRGTEMAQRLKIPVPAFHSDLPVLTINKLTPQGEWFRPVYDPNHVDPSRNEWSGVGSWGVAVAFASEKSYLKTRGNVGELVVRVNDNEPGSSFAFGIMTNRNHVDEMKWGELPSGDRGENAVWDMGAWVRTQPGVTLTVVDPDTATPYMVDGKPVTGTANDHGDIGFLLPSQSGKAGKPATDGRFAFVVDVTTAQGAQPFETFVSFGPNDKPDMPGNIVDLRTIAAKPAIPDQRSTGK